MYEAKNGREMFFSVPQEVPCTWEAKKTGYLSLHVKFKGEQVRQFGQTELSKTMEGGRRSSATDILFALENAVVMHFIPSFGRSYHLPKVAPEIALVNI